MTNATARNDQRIPTLIDAANRALRDGRTDEAAQLVRQAELESPQHPLVINEVGQRMLLSGNLERARELFEQAVQGDSSNVSLWINLAAALRGLNRRDEEMLALHRALALDPANLRAMLQKASLQEMQGDMRAAAFTYRMALRSITPTTQVAPWMQELLRHAKQVVEGNNRALESFLEDRLTSLRREHAHVPLRRFDRCMAILLQKKRIYQQQPSFLYFPELPAIEFHERAHFPWLDSIEAATGDIRAELIDVLAEQSADLEPYVAAKGSIEQKWRELNQSRRWSVYYLWRDGAPYQEHLARCPRTVAALQDWPRCEVPGASPNALFSILDARTRIPPHHGVNNTRLIVHLPLIVPPGCGFRVGGEQREWQPGKAFVFDDTIEHTAWNDSDTPRAVLIFDIWNPEVSPEERAMVSTAVAGVSEFYGFPQQRDVR
ncbi:MAG TPA: aspartyl/asparaginyl beta-hydroxylase domain-containing protein [Steroidobacteraceae bacterium]|jgi:aspartyl/asparaginyl beta-hydroxylase (cupin superfamily)